MTLSTIQVATPRGNPATFRVRDGTNDASVLHTLLRADEYKLGDRHPQGWAIDVGAHIGGVAIALALDNPGLRVLALEPVPGNHDLLVENILLNNLTGRVIPLRLAAGAPGQTVRRIRYGYTHFAEADTIGAANDTYLVAHTHIAGQFGYHGNPTFDGDVAAIGLDALLDDNQIDNVDLLKIDCEGCEWDFLNTPAIARVKTIVGEYHSGLQCEDNFDPNPVATIKRLLEPTHLVWFRDECELIGLFLAVRR